MAVSLGVHVGQQAASMAELRSLWRRLDDAGVDWISVWDHLYEAPPLGGTVDHFEALSTLGAQLNRRSLIILFTEFTDATSADLMIRAAGRLVKKHRLLFVVIRDDEVEEVERRRPESAADVTRANVAAAMLRDRQLVIARLQRLGADVIEVPADAMGASVVEAYLGIKRQGSL